MHRDTITTPIAQGTLISRVVWNNELKSDGIEVSLVRENGESDVLFTVSATEKGLLYDVTLLLDEMDDDTSIELVNDVSARALHLKTSE